MVPTLDHDGQIVIDSNVIIEYLDEVTPEASFTPEDPVKRAHMRSLMHFIDEMPAASVRVPTFNLAFMPKFQAMSRDDFIAMAESKPLRKEFMMAMGQTGFPQAEMDAALARLRRAYERMDAEIEASGGPWLLGKDISLADVSVMPALVRMDDLSMADWQDLPRVVTWFDNIRAHRRSSRPITTARCCRSASRTCASRRRRPAKIEKWEEHASVAPCGRRKCFQ